MTTRLPTIDDVKRVLDRRLEDETLHAIAAGAEVDYGWLCKFRYGQIGEPGWSKVRNLHLYLSKRRNGRVTA